MSDNPGAGAVIAGGLRDIAESRAIGYPIRGEGATPMTGKWRVETIEINGVIDIMGVSVSPGDLVIANENGGCFVPSSRAGQVLELSPKKVAAEKSVLAKLSACSA